MKQVSVEDARDLLGSASPPQLLDCRQPFELGLCRIDGAAHIPLMDIPDRALGELDPSRPVLVFCHAGVRSINAAVMLEGMGFVAMSMRGGIDAWSLRIDPTVPRY